MTFGARLLHRAGLDRATTLTLANRLAGVVAGLVTIVFIGRYLTPAAQGYYYTFSSLIALQLFVELGLTYAIVQFASHEMAHMTWTAQGTVQGDAAAKQRLQSLLRFALTWFGVAAVAMTAVLIPVGAGVIGMNPAPSLAPRDALLPWAMLVVLSSANLIVTAAVALLEGCGQVAQVALIRLVQVTVAAVAACSVLASGGALWAPAAQSGALLGVSALWLAWSYRAFLADLLAYRSPHPGLDWRRDIWPFHWRIAVSWASGYLIFQLFTPLLFATTGPVEAGQMGLSLQIMMAINGLAMAWIGAKVPMYGGMIARKEGRALDQLFLRGLVQSLFAILACLLAVMAGLWLLHWTGSALAQRVLPMPLMACMCAIALAIHIVSAQAALLRAHKQEPFMFVSIAVAVATALLAAVWIPAWGLSGAVAAYAASTGIGLASGTAVFLRKRKAWWLGDER